MIKLTHVINIVAKELMGTINAVSRVREALGDASVKKPPAIAAHVATTDGGDPTGTVANGGEGIVTADQGAGEGAVAEGKGLGEGAVDLPVAQVYEGRVHVGFVVCVLVVCKKPGVACRTPAVIVSALSTFSFSPWRQSAESTPRTISVAWPAW